ncbi:hypothetical protein Catovirus_1_451 [Catovirus CTV1]|uniref:Uncharacterized protein n=1 Tax=Catovirus CTV1 TaxID=1977631 RepID=A0A1V0S9M9_9VIRU|nr:hypothetical protein Catovirus_1_451 [Catovirus CTV1]
MNYTRLVSKNSKNKELNGENYNSKKKLLEMGKIPCGFDNYI